MVFVEVLLVVAPGPSEACPEEVGAGAACPVAARLVEAAAEAAFLAEGLPSVVEAAAAARRPCPGVGRTSGLAASRPGAYALRVSRAGGSFEGAAAALRCDGGSARTAAARALRRRLLNAARGALRRLTAFDFAGRGSCASLAARSSRYWDVPRAVFSRVTAVNGRLRGPCV